MSRGARLVALLLLMTPALWPATANAADTGWTITSFHSDISVMPDSSFDVVETIKVDFDGLTKHGIFRDIPFRYDYDEKHYRVYRISVAEVSNGAGVDWPYETSDQGDYRELKIGDPNRTISGAQTYLIHYRVEGALNGFSDHDELYWNVNGSQWPVPALQVDAKVHVPAASLQRSACYQGPLGSTDACRQSTAGDEVDFAATRTLPPGEQLTVVAAFAKGAVAAPAPILEQKPRTVAGYFEVTPATIAGSLLVLLAGLALVGLNWLRNGRDAVALDVHYRESQPRLRPLLNGPPVIARFEPPDGLRPAEVGTLLDERADTKDVTATIVDLAGRGFLRIDELPHHVFERKDWRLTATATPDRMTELKPYEAGLYRSLFPDKKEQQTLSELRGHFADDLGKVENQLYDDAAKGGWFVNDPRWTRAIWIAVGVLVILGGIFVFSVLGAIAGWGLVGVVVIIVGLAQVAGGFFMPRRTPAGSRLLDQALGFRLYMTTAEKYRQQFAEKENIFTDFLPYAIVFGCVDRWARAFQDLSQQAQGQAAWYGAGGWQALALSQSLQDFNEHLGSTLAAPPPHSGGGGSGFGGGFSGGGGGGGGGGSW